MTPSASASFLRSEFDDFLFAPIDEDREDRNGMLLSVLSALARLDVDPWQEAAKLARLPGETATQELAILIAALPDGASAHRDSVTIASRLIALLPRRARFNIPSREKLVGVGELINFRIFTYVILMVLVLSAQGIIVSRQLSTKVDNAQALTSHQQISPPDSGGH